MKIEVKNISKSYDNQYVIKDLLFVLDKPGLYYLDGTNGSGKTTFFNILGGLDRPDSGEVLINGKSIKAGQTIKNVSNFNVDFNLIDTLTVKQNLSLTNKKFDELISHFKLEELLDKRIKELSKGEKARIGIIKTLLQNNDVILLDEPFAYLDEDNAKMYFDYIKEYSQDHIIIISTHIFKTDLESSKKEIKINDKVSLKEVELKDVSKSICVDDIDNKSFKSYLSLLFSFISTKKVKLSVSLISVLVTTVLMVVSFNFGFTDDKKIFEQVLDDNNVGYGYLHETGVVEKKALKTLDNNVLYGQSVKLSGNTTDLLDLDCVLLNNRVLSKSLKLEEIDSNNEINVFLSSDLKDKYKVGDKIENYRFSGLQLNLSYPTKEVKPFQKATTMNVVGFVEGWQENSAYCYYKDAISKQIDSYIAFRFSEQLKNDLYNVLTKDVGGRSICENIFITTQDKETTDLLIDENLVNDKYGSELNFNEFFDKNIKNKTYEVSKDISLKITGYSLYKNNEVFGNASDSAIGLSVSKEIFNTMKNAELKDNYLITNNDEYFVPKETLIEKSCYKYAGEFSFRLENSNEESSIILYDVIDVINSKNTVSTILYSVSAVSSVLTFAFLVVFGINNYKENRNNLYILKKDGYSNANSCNVITAGVNITTIITLGAGLGIGAIVSKALSEMIINKYQLKQAVMFFDHQWQSYLISTAIVVITLVIVYLITYFKLKKTPIRDLMYNRDE